MSVAVLMQAMADAGAPFDAILLAVKALEEKDAEIARQKSTVDEKKAADAARKRIERAEKKSGKVKPDASKDSPRTIQGQSEDAPLNDIYSNPPGLPQSPDGDCPPPIKNEIDEVVSAWNAMAVRVGLGSIRGKLTGSRLSMLKARIAEHGRPALDEAIAAVERSPFCRGETKPDWKADFKFMVRPDNFTKLLEGGFEPRTKPGAPALAKPLDDAERERAAKLSELFRRHQADEISFDEFMNGKAELSRKPDERGFSPGRAKHPQSIGDLVARATLMTGQAA